MIRSAITILVTPFSAIHEVVILTTILLGVPGLVFATAVGADIVSGVYARETVGEILRYHSTLRRVADYRRCKTDDQSLDDLAGFAIDGVVAPVD